MALALDLMRASRRNCLEVNLVRVLKRTGAWDGPPGPRIRTPTALTFAMKSGGRRRLAVSCPILGAFAPTNDRAWEKTKSASRSTKIFVAPSSIPSGANFQTKLMSWTANFVVAAAGVDSRQGGESGTFHISEAVAASCRGF